MGVVFVGGVNHDHDWTDIVLVSGPFALPAIAIGLSMTLHAIHEMGCVFGRRFD
jgi:hypothetical protein